MKELTLDEKTNLKRVHAALDAGINAGWTDASVRTLCAGVNWLAGKYVVEHQTDDGFWSFQKRLTIFMVTIFVLGAVVCLLTAIK